MSLRFLVNIYFFSNAHITCVINVPFCCPLVENGYVHKAVNYDGEMFIIEEIQLYANPVPISALRLSSSKVTQSRCQ